MKLEINVKNLVLLTTSFQELNMQVSVLQVLIAQVQ
jgi:hypothetical protein